MSRERLGVGGNLRRGVSFASHVLGKHNWNFEPKTPIKDQGGVYAYTFVIERFDEPEQHNLLITARAWPPPRWWSVTEVPQKIAEDNEAWLVGYFDKPQQKALVFDPSDYDRIMKDVREREDTYEYALEKGRDLSAWASIRSIRNKQRKL